MYSLSAVLTVASLFATSGLSATVPYTPKFVGPTYVLAQNMDWSAGVIYDGDGKVAVKSYERDNKIFFNNGTTSYITKVHLFCSSLQSSAPLVLMSRVRISLLSKPTSICDDDTGSVDSTGVDFNVRTHDQYIMYSWRFTRSDKSYFTWTPYSPSTEGRNTVAGLVVRQGESADGQRGISGRIFGQSECSTPTVNVGESSI